MPLPHLQIPELLHPKGKSFGKNTGREVLFDLNKPLPICNHQAPCKKYFCDDIAHYYNRIEDANDKQIPNSFVNPHGDLVAANWTQQGIHEGHAQPEPVPCVYGVNSVVLIGKLSLEMTPSKVYVEKAMT